MIAVRNIDFEEKKKYALSLSCGLYSQLFISESYVQNSSYRFFESLDIDEGEKEGEGIYFIVYSRHKQTLMRYYSEAVTSAKRIKDLDESVCK